MKKIAIFGALMAFLPAPAYAYLDPGTGTMIVQAVVAGIAGALVTIKIYWVSVSSWVKNLLAKESGAE